MTRATRIAALRGRRDRAELAALAALGRGDLEAAERHEARVLEIERKIREAGK